MSVQTDNDYEPSEESIQQFAAELGYHDLPTQQEMNDADLDDLSLVELKPFVLRQAIEYVCDRRRVSATFRAKKIELGDRDPSVIGRVLKKLINEDGVIEYYTVSSPVSASTNSSKYQFPIRGPEAESDE